MKETLENSIKKSLENYELPYNADAWKAMSSKLDAAQPVAKPRFKWYIAASAVALISTCAYLYNSHNDGSTIENPNNEIAQNETTNTTDKNTGSNNEQEHSNPTFTAIPSNDQSNDQDENAAAQNNTIDLNSSDQQANNGPTGQNSTNQNDQASNDGSNNTNSDVDYNENDKSDDNQNNTSDDSHDFVFILPTVDNICQGERVNINNENEFDITVVYPNGLIWTGKANANTRINPSVSGVYLIGYNDKDQFVKEGSFNVLAAPSADFSFIKTDEKYDEKGLPSTFVTAEGNAQSYEWKMGESFINGKEATGHFFREGEHDVTLTVTDQNGCKASQKKSVIIEDQYNLMAMNSFVPTDIDPANNRFMPYSLTVRGDAFRMIIIDPADGHVIYETRDASKGWDGVDKQTGSMVKLETAYIWKVTLEDRKIGESPEYAGTVVPLGSRR